MLNNGLSDWNYVLNTIYRDAPASVTIIKGDWKTGKTDFGIHLAHDELKVKKRIVKRVAANVQCFEDKECQIPSSKDVEYIDNFDMMGSYIKQPGRKAFIYDEALKLTPSKRAMTALNAEWMKIIPELSKGGDRNDPGGCHLFVLTQEDSLTEKIFMNPTFKKAMWTKISLKMVTLKSNMLRKKFTFKNVPPTEINYNPYLGASWSMHPTSLSLTALPLELKVAMEYSKGVSTTDIQKMYPEELKDRKEVTRKIQKGLTILLANYQTKETQQEQPINP